VLETLGDHIVPAPLKVIPQADVDKFATNFTAKIPALVNSSLSNSGGIPILGTALAKSLDNDNLAAQIAQDVVMNCNALNPRYTDDLSGNVTVDTVHETATEVVPFGLPLGSFLTLTGPVPTVTIQVDLNYAAQFTIDPTTIYATPPQPKITVVDGNLSTNEKQFAGVSLPSTTLAVVEKAAPTVDPTAPTPSFSGTGRLNGVLPVTYTPLSRRFPFRPPPWQPFSLPRGVSGSPSLRGPVPRAARNVGRKKARSPKGCFGASLRTAY
jgi:hypothetical protein